MNTLLKTISVLLMWGVVAYMIIYVDPETVKDVGMEGMYLPFILVTTIAIGYTMITLYRSIWVAIITATLIGLGLILSVMQYMSTFTWIIITLIILFTIYLHKMSNSPRQSANSVE